MKVLETSKKLVTIEKKLIGIFEPVVDVEDLIFEEVTETQGPMKLRRKGGGITGGSTSSIIEKKLFLKIEFKENENMTGDLVMKFIALIT